MQLLHYLMILIIPGIIGALAFSIAARFKTEIQPFVALILDLVTLITMMVGLYIFVGIHLMSDMLSDFNSFPFTVKYTLLSSGIAVFYGVVAGLLRRIFFWLKR